ncbi:MAG: hypothetical protein FWE60_06120 [Oscillospiraceae bacterium]|nr:hypothetical protein [Oscillospiraceae bacterium]
MDKSIKRKSPLNKAIKLTAVTFLVLLAACFVVAPGGFSLFGIFDRFFFRGENNGLNEGTDNVKILLENNPRHFGIDHDMEAVVLDYFRNLYGGAGEPEYSVRIRYINAAFSGSFAVIELEESLTVAFDELDGYISSHGGINHTFSLRNRSNRWHIEAHEQLTVDS